MFISGVVWRKLPHEAMSLKRFMLRTEALKLYRNILRQLQKLPDKDQRKEIKDWARSDFEAHRHHEDENTIRSLLYQGQKQLEELERTIRRANS